MTRAQGISSIRLTRIEISAWVGEFAPASQRWHTCLGDYDLGTKIFTGPTQREAINELLDYYEQDNGELRA